MFKINPNMKYNNLGNTGLIVSQICYGNAGSRRLTHEQHVTLIRKCLELGINFYDTAQLYWDGQSETSYGKVFQEIGVPREQIVVSTKIWIAKNPQINSMCNTNKKHIKESIKASLARLQMDYVDVIYPHSYDENTPIEEICRAFHEVIEDGSAFYWGTSNWDADKVIEAFQICEKFNLHKPIAAQNQYNMLVRSQIQVEYLKLFQNYKYGLVSFNTLLGGYLTGKYLDDKAAEGRFNIPEIKELFQTLYLDMNIDREKCDVKLRQLREYAQKELNCSLAQLAVAWSLKFEFCSSALLGATSVQQLQNSLSALEIVPKLTTQVEGQVNKILQTHPQPQTNYKTWKSFPHIRPLAE